MMMALSDATTGAVAVVTVSAVIGPLLVVRANTRARRIEARLGTPNGAGNVSEMLGSIHRSVGKLLESEVVAAERLAKIETRLARDERLIMSLESRLDDDDRRLDGIETQCSYLRTTTSAVAGALGAARRRDDPEPITPVDVDVEDNQ